MINETIDDILARLRARARGQSVYLPTEKLIAHIEVLLIEKERLREQLAERVRA